MTANISLKDNLYMAQRGGRSSYFVRIMFHGQSYEIGLGSTKLRSRTEARGLAMQIKALVTLQHKHPHEAKDIVLGKKPEKVKQVTWGEVVKDVLALKEAEGLRAATLRSWQSRLRHTAQWNGRAVVAIDRARVERLLTPLWRETPTVAKSLLTYLDSVFTHCVARGYITSSPIDKATIVASLGKVKVKTQHREAIPWRDLPAYVSTLDVDKEGQRAVLCLILSGLRMNELLRLEYSMFDYDEQVITLPAEIMKTHKEHRIPITPKLGELLSLGNSHRKPFTGTDRVVKYALKDHSFTAHGFRSAFADWATEQGQDFRLIETQLAHVVGNTTTRSYTRTQLVEQRRLMMESYESFVLSKCE